MTSVSSATPLLVHWARDGMQVILMELIGQLPTTKLPTTKQQTPTTKHRIEQPSAHFLVYLGSFYTFTQFKSET